LQPCVPKQARQVVAVVSSKITDSRIDGSIPARVLGHAQEKPASGSEVPNPLAERDGVVFEVLENLEGTHKVEVLSRCEIFETAVEQSSSVANPALRDGERHRIGLDAYVLVTTGQEPTDRSGACSDVEDACCRFGQ
jgi:hypothetical protein